MENTFQLELTPGNIFLKSLLCVKVITLTNKSRCLYWWWYDFKYFNVFMCVYSCSRKNWLSSPYCFLAWSTKNGFQHTIWTMCVLKWMYSKLQCNARLASMSLWLQTLLINTSKSIPWLPLMLLLWVRSWLVHSCEASLCSQRNGSKASMKMSVPTQFFCSSPRLSCCCLYLLTFFTIMTHPSSRGMSPEAVQCLCSRCGLLSVMWGRSCAPAVGN